VVTGGILDNPGQPAGIVSYQKGLQTMKRQRVAYHPGTGYQTVKAIIHDLGSVPVEITDRETATAGGYDAVMLLGGADINPFLYGQPTTYAANINRERDIIEWIMVKQAIQRRLPHMGICRGHQMTAVAHGGILYQDIKAETGITHGTRNYHQIDRILPALRPHLPAVTTVLVNSLHHQAVSVPPSGFKVAAVGMDGIIEAIYRPGALGVQWHPELMVTSDDEWMKLFRWFILGGLQPG
jgi:putative glutamine amidotransferase